ncbi:MAG TPA: polyphosphate kinase 1 [Pyrinomonadaceae bacterium]|nr:polyphosphate kinase 1 [Pyrinomonadaceae bacterium]
MTTGAIKQPSQRDERAAPSKVELPPSLLHHQHLLLNRELSWLEFNARVLDEALDHSHPLLERLKFLSIFSTNLDEFFMIRVSGLKEEVEEEIVEPSADGMTPAEQLAAISRRLRPMLAEQMRCLREEILPQLEEHNIVVTSFQTLTKRERQKLNAYFLENIFPVLTPQAVDPSHPFPYISNRSLNLGLMIEPANENQTTYTGVRAGRRFTRIKVPPSVPRLVPVDETQARYIRVGELIAANTSALFPGMQTGPSYMFRVTRDADIEIMEDEANDLLRVMEQQLRKRRFGDAVRLEVAEGMPDGMVEYLTGSLELTPDDVYTIEGPLNLPDLMTLYDLPRPELKDRPLPLNIPAPLAEKRPIFDVIREQDILLHHPYTTYSTVTDFINAAAHDKDVLAIKICLYRTGQRSPVVQALMEASGQGKQVAALVELKARFDEENNIEWAKQLERAGVHVVYGLLGLKTHCKLALVVRREGKSLRRYVHVATGNYNPTTSRIYTDIGLLTADPEIGADATDLFNFLTGYSHQSSYRKLLIAPINLKERMLAFIERETKHCLAGRPARIVAKINSLTDTNIIRALYEASQAGVEIDLVVRGICSLRPGVAGLSENIRVSSIVGRFLEHSRIFYFANGGDEEVYIGSADWMTRNLQRRVEVIAPISDARLKRQLKEDVLDVYLRDNLKARRLLPDGTYQRVRPLEGERTVDSQTHFASFSA